MTTPQTTQALLDWFAEREGWKSIHAALLVWWHEDSKTSRVSHPLAESLDTAAMLFEKYLPGCQWWKLPQYENKQQAKTFYVTILSDFTQVRVPDTGNTREAELHDRLALAYAALNAKEKT